MADSYNIVGDKVVPYSGGRKHTDTSSWRDATDIELAQKLRIEQLELALSNLISIAEQCDGWESFPQDELDKAVDILNS